MKKTISIALILVLTISCFSACSAGQKLIGTWKSTDNEYVNAYFTFNEDGTGKVDPSVLDIDFGVFGDIVSSIAEVDMTYTVDGKTLSVTYSINVLTVSIPTTTEIYTMEYDKDTLTLTKDDGSTIHFTRQAEQETK